MKGIGFTTFQYLRMLCGADTVKPDVHISKAVREALGKQLSPMAVVELVEQSAKNMGIQARQLDYTIWLHYSKKKYE